ncbi:uncharacterized protein [Rutidosis leptorrhynchoides]|uniref:uncharacterized protein n=1 Tax=Rutidosis leptorrhynchoides TaxID=125765 RepID=UPI003A99070C
MSEDGAVWQWRRTPIGSAAGDLVELNNLLSSFRFDRSLKDAWMWSMSSDGMFKVKILASIIDQHILPSSSSQQSTLSNSLVPKKVKIFVWRALLRRLPVRTELDKRGIDLDSVLCQVCDDVVKTVDHSTIFFNQALEIWGQVFKWWDKWSFSTFSVRELFEFNGSSSMLSFGKKVWQAMLWISAYLIWKNRNNKVFQSKCWNSPVALNEIQIISFERISNIWIEREKVRVAFMVTQSEFVSQFRLRRDATFASPCSCIVYYNFVLVSDVE